MAGLARPLTNGEAMVLGLIQEHYGAWNTTASILFLDQGEAVIFVKDAQGELPICVNLTVCASMYSDGLLSLKQLKADWLRIPDVERE